MGSVIIRIKDIFSDVSFIGTRPSGEKIRAIMEKEFDKGNTVVLDFEGIEGITQSFGDEIIGIYTRYYGKEFIKSHIKAVNYNDEIKEILNWVVSYSNKWHKENKENIPETVNIKLNQAYA
jgi:NTP pyrophosphatase (non-canonical NTP hydrolase)